MIAALAEYEGKRARIADGVLISEVSGEAVLLHLGSERYFGLDETGTRFWKVLLSSETIPAAAAKLVSEFDVDEERLAADLAELLGNLQDSGLIEIAE